MILKFDGRLTNVRLGLKVVLHGPEYRKNVSVVKCNDANAMWRFILSRKNDDFFSEIFIFVGKSEEFTP